MGENTQKTIAVLDDEPYVCDFLSKVLTGAGYRVLSANDGQQGLKLINTEKPDLVILDLIMPGLSGYALLDILNAKGSRIPVLVVSSAKNITDNLAHQGIAGLLIKPIDEERLLIHVDCIFKLEEAGRQEQGHVSPAAAGVAGASAPRPPEAVGAAEFSAPQSAMPPRRRIRKPEAAASGPTQQREQPPPQQTVPAQDFAQAKEASPDEQSLPAAAAAGRAAEEPGQEAPLVLVVEDEPDMQMIVAKLLEHQGFRVITADDGPMGLELAQKHLPDVMILDLMLPKMDGFQVCRLLKFNDKYRQIPIIILTARSLPADRELAEVSGADAYIVKPFEVESLMKTINSVRVRR